MPKRFSERILEYLKRPEYKPMGAQRLARELGIAEAQYGDFHDAVDALRRIGRVVIGTGNALLLPQPTGPISGTYRANPRGFGFVVPDEPTAHGDLFIPPGHALDAITGDKVLCKVIERNRREGQESFGGRIVKILERGNSRIVGQLRHEGGIWFVQPDGNALHVPILIGDPTAKSAKAGDQVVAEIVSYPSEGRPARGVIVERLGQTGQPKVDLLSIVRQYLLPDAFPRQALDEAKAAARHYSPQAIEGRLDISALTTITIDPDNARDFDDAITLEPVAANDTSQGGPTHLSHRKNRENKRSLEEAAAKPGWELGVHIADVSHFVQPGQALDQEARTRGTSVYFPRQVIPMLPETLSNGVCSLQEGEPRLCKSAFIRYDHQGHIVGTRFANTIICSTKRLTYGEATTILEGHTDGYPANVVELVRRMDRVAKTIRQRRLNNGMLELDLPEVDVVLDDDGRPVDARPADTSFSHKIIETFMVEANEAVARLLRDRGVPFLRRIHPEPDEAAIETMARFLRSSGLALPRSMEAKDMQSLLTSLRGRPEAYAVNLAVLKSLQLAEYSPEAVGHYGLGSDCYAHFTSPIRRYPDLMIHRLLGLYLDGRFKRGRRGLGEDVPGDEELREAGRQMSYLARRAESAEREYKTLKILQLLEQQVGEVFEGVVTGVTNFGLFVQHPRYLIDGLLRIEHLGDDWWEVDLSTGRMVGTRTHQTFTLGKRISVQIAQVDLSARQLNLGLSPDETRKTRSPEKRSKPVGQSRKTRQRPTGRTRPRQSKRRR